MPLLSAGDVTKDRQRFVAKKRRNTAPLEGSSAERPVEVAHPLVPLLSTGDVTKDRQRFVAKKRRNTALLEGSSADRPVEVTFAEHCSRCAAL